MTTDNTSDSTASTLTVYHPADSGQGTIEYALETDGHLDTDAKSVTTYRDHRVAVGTLQPGWTHRYAIEGRIVAAAVADVLVVERNGTAIEVPEPEPDEPDDSGDETADEPTPPVTIEAEAGDVTAPFEVRDDSTVSSGAYITTPDEGRAHYDGPPSDGRARYAFTVPDDGRYEIGLRMAAVSNGNSFYVRVDDDWGEIHADIVDGWQWVGVGPMALAAGTHTLEIAYREDGAALDAVEIAAAESAESGDDGAAVTQPTAGDADIYVSFESKGSMDPLADHRSGYIHNNFDLLNEFDGRQGVGRIAFPEGSHQGATRHCLFEKNGFDEPDECWAQLYVRFDDDFAVVDGGGKLPGFAGKRWSDGSVKDGATGSNGFTLRGGFRPTADTWGDKWGRGDADPQAVPIELTFYAYHADMDGQYGDQWSWDGEYERGRWYRIDQHLRMNTPGQRDGVLEAWVDGARVFRKADVILRDSSSDFGIESFWFDFYYGGGWTSPRDNYVYVDDLALRIDGPLADDLD